MNRLWIFILGACSLIVPVTARASSFAGAAGAESFQARGGSGSRAALGIAAADFERADVLAQVARYEDELTGAGWSFTAGTGVRLAGPLRARVRATRTMGDASFRAWQLRAGPEWRFGERGSLAVSYESDAIADSVRMRGATAEGLLALAPRLTARAVSSWSRDAGANRAFQGALGAIWRAAPHLALSADAGWLSAQGASEEIFPVGGSGGGLPLLGGGNSQTTGSRTSVVKQSSPTLLLGARVLFP